MTQRNMIAEMVAAEKMLFRPHQSSTDTTLPLSAYLFGKVMHQLVPQRRGNTLEGNHLILPKQSAAAAPKLPSSYASLH